MTAEPREPRWLDDAEQHTWLALMGVVIRLPAALDAQLQRDADLSHFDYAVLANVSVAPGRAVRLGALSRFAHVSPSHLSRVVVRLEGRGLLRREPDPGDGRAALAVLTGEGLAMLEATAPGHVETVRRHVFDRLTPTQVRQLRRICEALMEGLDPDDVPAHLRPPGR